MKARSRRRLRLQLTWLFSVALVVTVGVTGLIWLINGPGQKIVPLSTGCTVELSGAKYSLAPDQAANAALIAGIADHRKLPPRAVTIAIAVALQESKLRNITHGDMDSLGMFQQRPSQGWGTAAQIQDPVYATNKFFDYLVKVPDYQKLSITKAGQAVQHSAYPDAYGKHEALARAYASALTGYAPSAVNCTLKSASKPGDPSKVLAALNLDFGKVLAQSDSYHLKIPVQAGNSGMVNGWAKAQWAVAQADALSINRVSFDGKVWDRNNNRSGSNLGWQPDKTSSATVVDIQVQAP